MSQKNKQIFSFVQLKKIDSKLCKTKFTQWGVSDDFKIISFNVYVTSYFSQNRLKLCLPINIFKTESVTVCLHNISSLACPRVLLWETQQFQKKNHKLRITFLANIISHFNSISHASFACCSISFFLKIIFYQKVFVFPQNYFRPKKVFVFHQNYFRPKKGAAKTFSWLLLLRENVGRN